MTYFIFIKYVIYLAVPTLLYPYETAYSDWWLCQLLNNVCLFFHAKKASNNN